jgi:hypothetical protein
VAATLAAVVPPDSWPQTVEEYIESLPPLPEGQHYAIEDEPWRSMWRPGPYDDILDT